MRNIINLQKNEQNSQLLEVKKSFRVWVAPDGTQLAGAGMKIFYQRPWSEIFVFKKIVSGASMTFMVNARLNLLVTICQ